MKAFIMPNLSKKAARIAATELIKKLASFGIEGLISDKSSETLGLSERNGLTDEELFSKTDIVIPLGGDGTIIHAAKRVCLYGKPVLGVNAGKIGFLSELECTELEKLSLLRENKFRIIDKMMLSVCVGDKTSQALNEITVTRGNNASIIDADIFCNGTPTFSYRADGVIFSTPTGSTAYSLSAGGPIIDPRLECITMTPICPHSLISRSVVFTGTDALTVRINSENGGYICADGENEIFISGKDIITVKKSDKTVRFIKLGDKAFYETLNKKLAFKRVAL